MNVFGFQIVNIIVEDNTPWGGGDFTILSDKPVYKLDIASIIKHPIKNTNSNSLSKVDVFRLILRKSCPQGNTLYSREKR